MFGRTGSDYQPKPAAAVPLYSQYRVCSSVHPGTAKPLVTVGTVTRWAGRKWRSCGLERSTVAASAEAHKVINRPKAKTDRIAFAPRKNHRARGYTCRRSCAGDRGLDQECAAAREGPRMR